MVWAQQLARNQRVCSTKFKWGGKLSTVYLGLDHNIFGEGPPLIFETMLFTDGKEGDNECWRYATEKEAIANHSKLARKFKDGFVEEEEHEEKRADV